MSYTPLNLYEKQILRQNAIVHIVEQDDTLNPDNSDTTGSLKGLEESKWNLLANINEITITPETEDDEIEYFDDRTKTRIKDPQTTITRHTVEMEAVNCPVILDAILKGVPNPTSAETIAQLSAGSEDGAPIFATNDPYVYVGVRVKVYDSNKRHMQTWYFYARIKATEAVTLNGKTVKPKITAETQQSEHNRLFNTDAFTKQKQSA